MRLTEYLRSDLALTGLTGGDVEEVIRSISTHLADHLHGFARDELHQALLDREEQHTTTLGKGVAIPHATVAGLDDPVLMVARAPEAIQFGPPGTDPVRIFFVLVSPPGQERDHIKLLARICRLVRLPGFVEELLLAENAKEILRAIERMDQEHV